MSELKSNDQNNSLNVDTLSQTSLHFDNSEDKVDAIVTSINEDEDNDEDQDEFPDENTFQRYITNKMATKRMSIESPKKMSASKEIHANSSSLVESTWSLSDTYLDALWMILQAFIRGPSVTPIRLQRYK